MSETMMRIFVALLLLVVTTDASPTAVADFMKAMDAAVARKKSELKLKQNLLSKAVLKRRLEDGGGNDDAAAADDYGDLDLKDYALKYVGCQNVRSFSDDLAEDEDAVSVLAMNRFVMFRFCRSDLCSSYNKYGCDYDFGEYVIEMEAYLEAMAAYHYDRYEEYCATCLECMTPSSDDDANDAFLNYTNYTNYTSDDELDVDYNITDGNETLWSAKRDCQYYSACKNYQEACKGYFTKATEYEEFFTCTEFKVGNNVGYLGPHCSKDGKTIKIGIFDDENCESYIGNIVNLEQFTGMQFDDWGLSFYDSGNCISCVNQDEWDLFTDDAVGNQVYELCEVLYDTAGKCNRYLDIGDIDETYETYQQADNEKKVCDFVEGLVTNAYDEYGEIILTSESFDLDNWKDYHEYQKLVPEVTPLQIAALVGSATVMLFLMVYSCYLYSKLRNPRWNPDERTVGAASEAGRISRMNSGIMMGRSTSAEASIGAFA